MKFHPTHTIRYNRTFHDTAPTICLSEKTHFSKLKAGLHTVLSARSCVCRTHRRTHRRAHLQTPNLSLECPSDSKSRDSVDVVGRLYVRRLAATWHVTWHVTGTRWRRRGDSIKRRWDANGLRHARGRPKVGSSWSITVQSSTRVVAVERRSTGATVLRWHRTNHRVRARAVIRPSRRSSSHHHRITADVSFVPVRAVARWLVGHYNAEYKRRRATVSRRTFISAAGPMAGVLHRLGLNDRSASRLSDLVQCGAMSLAADARHAGSIGARMRRAHIRCIDSVKHCVTVKFKWLATWQ